MCHVTRNIVLYLLRYFFAVGFKLHMILNEDYYMNLRNINNTLKLVKVIINNISL